MAESFNVWLDALRDRRQRWGAASHENNFDRGIWNATVEKYADPTHFIFELLQNAEDADASWARFELTKDAVIFHHNGRPFERKDIEGITGIGNTTKLDEANKIGSFGIGFKSVYVVAERPEVHCTVEGQSIAFAIHDLVVPELIACVHGSGSTRFVLPLPPDKATATIEKVRLSLEQAGARSLLYLRHLKRLEWSDGELSASCQVEDDSQDIRTLRSVIDDKPQTDRFLMLTRAIRREDVELPLSVKIAMRLNDGGDVVPEPTPTRLSVFFETEEVTGLHFHIHGPFQLTDNRANIKRDNPWNSYVINELATLLAESLASLRDRGYLKRSFLEVLPNASDDLSAPWDRLRNATHQAFRENALLPAHAGDHIRSVNAVRGPSDIRDLLGDVGLGVFGRQDGRRWAVGTLRNGRSDSFLAGLELTEFGQTEFLNAFHRAFGPSYVYSSDHAATQAARNWFDALDDDAVQRLYLLVDASLRLLKRAASLPNVSFVRLENGTRVTPSDALLPPSGAPVDEEAAAHGIVLVRTSLLRAGRGRGKDVEQFLRRVGVKEIGERDYLRAIIRSNYASGATTPSAERHMQHMRRFLRWYAEHNDPSILRGIAFLRAEGTEGYHSADTIFLDQPYLTSGLHLIYDGKVKGRDRLPLWSGYGRLKKNELLALLRQLGVEDSLKIERTNIRYGHPHRYELIASFGSARQTDSGHDIDYSMSELSGLLARKNVDISKMIWKAVAAEGSHVMRASYVPNRTHDPHRAPSSLALGLRDSAWIPAKDGTLRKPSAITAAELAPGLSTTGNEEWLQAIGFAADQRRRSEEHSTRRKAAQAIGLPPELADQLASLSPEALRALGAEMMQRVTSGGFSKPEFPEQDSVNPERRSARMAQRALSAPSKSYEIRNRNVRTSDGEARALARPYLLGLYTNRSKQMICQACHEAMPFDRPDGTPYFEAPQLLGEVSTEHPENHLALCPTCCAKWHHARGNSDEAITNALLSAEAPEIVVSLAGEETTVRFVQVHFDDMRTIISALQGRATASLAT
ncbi:sacsin N-terminal ATP-binding-like domain-containing protein [Bradyrhizobium sp. DASA03005]|uniref:sacsin N-terminal ATP-binding-like domain-containing protein n=1 Tax=Bradyrhizobium sp. SPXBL-02 TaxID=3395912 RepID=UPI003F70C311